MAQKAMSGFVPGPFRGRSGPGGRNARSPFSSPKGDLVGLIRLIRLTSSGLTRLAPARGAPYLIASRIPPGPGRGVRERAYAVHCPLHFEIMAR